MQDYKVVSLFSGCGGLDLGIEGGFKYLNNYYDKNPFKIIWANDINEKFPRTFSCPKEFFVYWAYQRSKGCTKLHSLFLIPANQ